MSIVDFIAVVSFGLTCFGLGYSFGKDNNKTQKQPPRPGKLSGYSQLNNFGSTVYRWHPFCIINISRIGLKFNSKITFGNMCDNPIFLQKH